MRVVLDACVLFPTVLREILLALAADGMFEPVWSERLLEEWVRATARLGPEAPAIARAEAALARASFPRALRPVPPEIEARLSLPDPADIHVLALAIAAHADAILTFNAQDFPRPVLAAYGIARRDPDGFLWELWSHQPARAGAAIETVRARAEAAAGAPVTLVPMLRRLRLFRLARAMGAD